MGLYLLKIVGTLNSRISKRAAKSVYTENVATEGAAGGKVQAQAATLVNLHIDFQNFE
jgi:hypothetical protein